MDRNERLANILEKMIQKKPYDDYILVDKNLLWKVIEALRRK